MLGLYLKKLFLLFPLLFLLSVIVFFVRFATPQDPVEQSLGVYQQEESEILPYSKSEYEQEAIKLGLDKEQFYFSIRPNYINYEVSKLLIPSEKKTANAFLRNGFRWTDTKAFIHLKNTNPNNLLLTQITNDLIKEGKTDRDYSQLDVQDQAIINNILGNHKKVFYYPTFKWNGTNNQYHQWIKDFFSSKELRSTQNNSLIKPKIKRALGWTIIIAFLSTLISYSLGILIGIKQVSSNRRLWSRLQTVLDFFFTMPFFWIATLAIIFFTTSDYGRWTNIFPSVHSIDFNGEPILKEIIKNLDQLILPILCISLHSIGFISSMMADNLKQQLSKPYFLTAIQKGFTKNEILRNHGFKNAIFPILTMLSHAIPAAFSGSLIVEIIFNLPGMGRLLYNSILLADWNVVFPIVLMIGLITSFSFWLSDVLYGELDPRSKTTRS